MTTNHIDQLTEWWETAEQGAPKPGDTIIIDLGDDGYRIDTASTSWVYWERYGDTRILARAPKPKPAWHDAVAVTATFRDERGMVTGVWRPEGKPGYWEGPEGDVVHGDSLEAVTPLIEAKVTDEARERVWECIQKHTGEDDRYRPDYDAEIDGYIAAALRLDTE